MTINNLQRRYKYQQVSLPNIGIKTSKIFDSSSKSSSTLTLLKLGVK